MPAYSFQERFIPFLLDESKRQTVRKERARTAGYARQGSTIYLYYGMRTKYCRKIGEGICTEVWPITITEDSVYVSGLKLDHPDLFAWCDGFRPEGTTISNPSGAFDLMLRFWRQTHELPFQGVVIFWKDFKPTK